LRGTKGEEIKKQKLIVGQNKYTMKWERVELGEVCEIRGGYAFKSKNFRKSGIPIIRISNISHNKVNIIEGTPCAPLEDLDKYHSFKIYKNDVLIALSGATTGKYGIYKHNTPALLNQRVGLIKSKDESILNTKYFFFYLEKLKEEVLRKASGVAQPNISTKEISKLKIPLPPLPEQRRIAARLDKADALRQKSREILQVYEELGRSVFLEVFGDEKLANFEKTSLDKVADVVSGVAKGKKYKEATLIEIPGGASNVMLPF